MKKYILLISILFCINNLFAIDLVSKTDTGTIGGADYKILFPKNWKGKLVMYAHGYEFVGASPRQSKDPSFENWIAPFLKRGFAVAASDYSVQGFAFNEGVNDTEELRKYFFNKYGRPDSTFVVGHSMGGGIAVAIMEKFSKNYNGGFPLCPLTSRPYLQLRLAYDFYATISGLIPGILPTLSELTTLRDSTHIKTPFQINKMVPQAMAIQKAIIQRDSTLAIDISKKYGLDVNNLAFSILFNQYVLRDIFFKAKGNPFDNTNTMYSGFADDWQVNKKVERLAATVNQNILFGVYDRTGDINKPIMLMHTVHDKTVTPTYGEVNYENMVAQKDKLNYLTVKITNGSDHCIFTPEETGQAFDELRNWIKTGKKAESGILE